MNQEIRKAEAYLRSQNIATDDSEFLRKHIQEEEIQNKLGFDPRDVQGARLSVLWKPGDTVWTVSVKRLLSRLEAVFNPDTYSTAKLNELRKYAALHQLEVYSGLFMMCLPIIFAVPFILPKFKRIKRQFLLNQFMKRRFYEEELKVVGQRITKAQMETIVAEAYRKHNI